MFSPCPPPALIIDTLSKHLQRNIEYDDFNFLFICPIAFGPIKLGGLYIKRYEIPMRFTQYSWKNLYFICPEWKPQQKKVCHCPNIIVWTLLWMSVIKSMQALLSNSREIYEEHSLILDCFICANNYKVNSHVGTQWTLWNTFITNWALITFLPCFPPTLCYTWGLISVSWYSL